MINEKNRIYGKTKEISLDKLKELFNHKELNFIKIALIDEEMYKSLIKAISFRNSKIYDYMDFNVEILSEIVKNRYYLDLYNFLVEIPNYNEVLIKRIENFNI